MKYRMGADLDFLVFDAASYKNDIVARITESRFRVRENEKIEI